MSQMVAGLVAELVFHKTATQHTAKTMVARKTGNMVSVLTEKLLLVLLSGIERP
jgi:hypothetical protein